jgi:hypothetical protein
VPGIQRGQSREGSRGQQVTMNLTPAEREIWIAAFAAFAVAFGSLLAAAEKATQIIRDMRVLDRSKLTDDAVACLMQVRAGR